MNKLVIFITFEDTGRNFSCYGGKFNTPKIDEIASEGTMFTNHFSTGCVCTPSRGTIQSGQFYSNTKLRKNQPEPTALPRQMSKLGYETYAVGKPESKYFSDNSYSDNTPKPAEELLGYDKVITDVVNSDDSAEHIIDIIKQTQADSKPRYIYANFRQAHGPYVSSVTKDEVNATELPSTLDKVKDIFGVRETMALINKDTLIADTALGEIVDYIKANNLKDQVILAVSADHGLGILRGKQTLYDQGTGVIMLYWGSDIDSRVVDGLSSHTDILPTLVELAGGTVSGKIDGISTVPIIDGTQSEVQSFVFSERCDHMPQEPIKAIRTKEYKYIRNYNPGYPIPRPHDAFILEHSDRLSKIYGKKRPFEEFYHVTNDPDEWENLVNNPEYTEVLDEHRNILDKLLAEKQDMILDETSIYTKAMAFCKANNLPISRGWDINEEGDWIMAPVKPKVKMI